MTKSLPMTAAHTCVTKESSTLPHQMLRSHFKMNAWWTKQWLLSSSHISGVC